MPIKCPIRRVYKQPCLLQHHMKMLRDDSAINNEVIIDRGYRSINDPNTLKSLGFANSQCRVPGLLIPVHHVTENWLDKNPKSITYQYRPDTPRQDEKGRIIKYEIPAGSKLCLDVPTSIQNKMCDPFEPLWITEGSKKADSAICHGLCCIALMGVWGWDVSDWQLIELRHRRVYIAFDSDVMTNPKVHEALRRFVPFLRSRGATVNRIYLHSTSDGRKVGLDDYFAADGTKTELFTFTRRDNAKSEIIAVDENTLPSIETHNRQSRDIGDDMLRALVKANNPPSVFVSGGSLVRIQHSKSIHGDFAKIEPLNKDALARQLSLSANFHSISDRGRRNVNPPDAIVKQLASLPEWPGIPYLEGIVTSPTFAPDGTLCAEPGYYESAQIYYQAAANFALSDTTPYGKNIINSIDLFFDDLFADFPFADDASKAHTLAMTLLPFVRPMIQGPTPLHLVDAPRPGTGKSLLASASARVFAPHGIAVYTAPKTEDEWRKRLTTLFREGTPIVLFDNVTKLDSSSLQAALTSPDCRWSDRLLGGNRNCEYPIRCSWIATCNNISGSRELLRRCVWIRLDAKRERPDQRTEFKYQNLSSWQRAHRKQLVTAAITIIRAWIDGGMPDYSGSVVFGSFEEWTRVMGGILENIGVEGFLENSSQLMEQSGEDELPFRLFVDDWFREFSDKQVGAGDLLHIAIRYFEDELGDGSKRSQAIRLGKMLGKYRDWVVEGNILLTKQTKNGQQYRLQPNK